MKRTLALVAVVLLAACSGGGGDGPEETTTTESTTTTEGDGDSTTTTEGEAAASDGALDDVRDLLAEPDLGHRFASAAGREAIRGEVESATRYRIVSKLDGIQFELLVVDGVAFTRSGGEETLATARYVEDDAALFDPRSALEDDLDAFVEDWPADDDFVSFVVRQVLSQLAAIEPVAIVEALLVDGTLVAEVDEGTRLRGRVDLGVLGLDELAELVDGPLLEAVLDGDGNPLRLRFPASEDDEPAIDVEIEDYGDEVAVDEPSPDQIDQTPDVAEEALAAFADAPLVVPVPVPAGFTVFGARVLRPEETTEDCNQVAVSYDTPDGDFLDVFVLDAACAQAFDTTPFDLTVGGHPAREVHILEILVGETVVQFDTTVDDATVEAIAATLAPVSAEELIAMATTG